MRWVGELTLACWRVGFVSGEIVCPFVLFRLARRCIMLGRILEEAPCFVGVLALMLLLLGKIAVRDRLGLWWSSYLVER